MCFPNPTPPYKNKGLNVTGPISDTRFAAACANSFGFPTTNLSKVNLLSKGEEGNSIFLLSKLFFILDKLLSLVL